MNLILFLILIYLSTVACTVFAARQADRIAPFLIGLAGLLYQLIVNRDEKFSETGFILAKPGWYLQGVALICAVLALVGLMGWTTGLLRPRSEFTAVTLLKLAINIPVYALIVTLVAICTEELVFRGIVQRQLAQTMSPLPAIILSSLLFGVWHMAFLPTFNLSLLRGGLYFLGTTLAGMLLGIYYHESQSLLVCGLMHGVWNSISYTLFGLGTEIPGLLASRNESLTNPEYGLYGVLVLGLAVALKLFLQPLRVLP